MPIETMADVSSATTSGVQDTLICKRMLIQQRQQGAFLSLKKYVVLLFSVRPRPQLIRGMGWEGWDTALQSVKDFLEHSGLRKSMIGMI
jgi:hypothetical protein